MSCTAVSLKGTKQIHKARPKKKLQSCKMAKKSKSALRIDVGVLLTAEIDKITCVRYYRDFIKFRPYAWFYRFSARYLREFLPAGWVFLWEMTVLTCYTRWHFRIGMKIKISAWKMLGLRLAQAGDFQLCWGKKVIFFGSWQRVVKKNLLLRISIFFLSNRSKNLPKFSRPPRGRDRCPPSAVTAC